MKRIFVFSYHGKETFHTSYYRLLSLSQSLSQKFEVHFVSGNTEKLHEPVHIEGNLIEIPLNYSKSIFNGIYKYLLDHNRNALAKVFLIIYYFFTGAEIFDLNKEFQLFILKTNLVLNENDVVIVSFPSISIHNLGFVLKQKFGCKLILDYRDPGVFGYQHVSENKIVSFLRKLFLKKREIRNLKKADLILAISESIKSIFPKKYISKISVIKNGFIDKKADLSLITNNTSTFIIAYLGTIYDTQLKDKTFFKAVRKFIDDEKILPHEFQIKFLGSAGSRRLEEIIKSFKLDPYVIITPRKPIEQIYEELYDVSMFLHLKYGNRRAIITSKQYEYLAFKKPILLPVSDFGDIQESILLNKAGYVCNHIDEIIDVLTNQFNKHQNGEFKHIERTSAELYQLSRKSQEDKLLNLINDL